MLLHLPDVLTADQVAYARRRLDEADWVDGRVTAGHQSAQVKRNLQLPEDHQVANELGDLILEALRGNALFVSAALPLRVFPPLFNRGCFHVTLDRVTLTLTEDEFHALQRLMRRAFQHFRPGDTPGVSVPHTH